MRALLVRFSFSVLASVLAVGAVFVSGQAASSPAPSFEDEVTRIRAHLARVEAELRAADVSGLTAQQRAARARHLDVLRTYREAGVFPHNHAVDRRTPVFVDEHGTHCAVGFLITSRSTSPSGSPPRLSVCDRCSPSERLQLVAMASNLMIATSS